MVVKAKIANREWYQAYCAAMLETDMDKVFASVESARRAIQTRAKELGGGLANSNHESKELDRALRFLTMLVNCAAPAQSPGFTPTNLPIAAQSLPNLLPECSGSSVRF